MAIQGSCLCGAVRYEVTGPVTGAGHCHCSMCRKSHGAAFATWGFVDPEHFRWTSGEDQVSAYVSSPGHERCFCRKCGAPLVARQQGEIREVVLASIDGDPGIRPSEHIFVGSKAVWHDITDSLPQWPAFPDGTD